MLPIVLFDLSDGQGIVNLTFVVVGAIISISQLLALYKSTQVYRGLKQKCESQVSALNSSSLFAGEMRESREKIKYDLLGLLLGALFIALGILIVFVGLGVLAIWLFIQAFCVIRDAIKFVREK